MRSKNFSRFLKPSQLNLEFVERFFVLLISICIFWVSFFFYETQRQINLRLHETLSPIYNIFSIPNNYLNIFLSSFKNYANLKSANDKLTLKLMESQDNLDELYHLKVENQQLKNLLNVQAPPSSTKIVSRIVLDPSDIYSSKIFIDVGFDHGIKINTPVFNENGFLGRIIHVSDNVSEVLLLNDPRSTIPVISEISKIKFFVEGNFENLKIKHASSNENFIDDELVISTSASGYFKKGIIVGKLKIFKNKIRVIPSAKKDDSVYVMTLGYDYLREFPKIDQK